MQYCSVKGLWQKGEIDFLEYLAYLHGSGVKAGYEIYRRWVCRQKIVSGEKLERFGKRFYEKHDLRNSRFRIQTHYPYCGVYAENSHVRSLKDKGIIFESESQDVSKLLMEAIKCEHRRVARNTGRRITKIDFWPV